VDIFSGTGALGLEALSRGAASVYFVEYDKRHVKYMEQNLAAVKKSMGGREGTTQIICSDARNTPSLLCSIAGNVSILLADPPYAEDGQSYGANALVQDMRIAEWAGKGCILALEHASSNIMPWHPLSPWSFLRGRSFGIRAVSFAKIAAGES